MRQLAPADWLYLQHIADQRAAFPPEQTQACDLPPQQWLRLRLCLRRSFRRRVRPRQQRRQRHRLLRQYLDIAAAVFQVLLKFSNIKYALFHSHARASGLQLGLDHVFYSSVLSHRSQIKGTYPAAANVVQLADMLETDRQDY